MICALLMGEAEDEQGAARVASRFGGCPYVGFMANGGKRLFAAYFIPPGQRWWIEAIGEKPDLLGLVGAEVFFVDEVQYPKGFEMRLPETPKRLSPCGADCSGCPAYERCLGCPATIFYKKRSDEGNEL